MWRIFFSVSFSPLKNKHVAHMFFLYTTIPITSSNQSVGTSDTSDTRFPLQEETKEEL